MHIDRLHIYGFGRHIEKQFSLRGQLHCFVGENESGKSTVREFIEQMLFGFPPKLKGRRSFEPQDGSAFGGVLELTDERYGAIRIERIEKKSGKSLTVRLADGSEKGEPFLQQLLGDMDRPLFDSVFSCSVLDLQGLEKMDEEELNRTLLASATTGTLLLPAAAADLRKKAEALFKPSGRKPPINAMATEALRLEGDWRALAAEEEAYAPAAERLAVLAEDLAELAAEEARLRAESQRSAVQAAYAPLLAKRERLAAEAEAIRSLPIEPEQVRRAEALAVRLEEAERRLEEARATAAAGMEQEVAFKQDGGVLALEPRWLALRERGRALDREEADLRAQSAELAVDLRSTEESDLESADRAAAPPEAYEELSRAVDRRAKAEKGREAVASGRAPLLFAGAIAIIGAALLLAIDRTPLPSFGAASAGFLCLVAAAVMLWRGAAKQRRARQAALDAEKELSAACARAGISPALLLASEDPALLLRRWIAWRAVETRRARTGAQRREMDEEMHSILDRIEEELGAPVDSDDPFRELKRIHGEANARKLAAAAERQAAERHRESIEADVEQSKRELGALLRSAGSLTVQQYREAAREQAHRTMLLEQIGELDAELAEASLSADRPLDEAALEERAAALASRRRALLEEQARLQQRVSHLFEGEAVNRAQAAFESRRADLQEAAEEWAAYTALAAAMEEELASLHEERLPAVLALADRYLVRLTAGHFERLVWTGASFEAKRTDGRTFRVHELSQATKEQCYLALRFAFAVQMSKGVPMPLLLDDPFVHFDRAREAEVLQLLEELAGQLQVFYFTCRADLASSLNSAQLVQLSSPLQKGAVI